MRFRRHLFLAATTLLISLGTALGATAAPGSAPTDIAAAFTNAYLAGDARACDVASTDVKALLARMTNSRDCTTAMAIIKLGAAAKADATEKDRLRVAYEAAIFASKDHLIILGGKAAWFDRGFPVAALARAIHAEAPSLRVRLGSGPRAARGTAANVVVVDTTRSTPARLVLYGESADGTIWRLSGTPAGKPAVARAAVHGVAAAAPRPSVKVFPFAPAAPTDTTLVVASFIDGSEPIELLLPVGADGLVLSFLAGRAAIPTGAGVGAGDTTALAAMLTKAYASTVRGELCNLIDPRLLVIIDDDSCSVAGEPTPAVDVTTPAQRFTTGDGSTLVAIRLGNAPEQLTVINLAVPTAAGYRVTGVFVDLAELAELVNRAI